METLGVLLCAFVVSSSGYLIKLPTVVRLPDTSDLVLVNLVDLQKRILPLFEDVCETSKEPDIVQSAQQFLSLLDDDFVDPEVISNFKTLQTKGLLAKGEIFTEYNTQHLNELKVVFEVLRDAKNFDVFFKAVAWARQNLNCGVYVNALYLAIEKRRDTNMLLIPPPYEILPNYFVDKEVIIQGSFIASGQDIELSDNIEVEGNAYTINANYTGSFFENEDESKLAYFREDVGLNTFYYLWKLRQASWFNNDIVNGQYGENMFHMMKQLDARYNLERFANKLPELTPYTWSSMPNVPYNPALIYTNGNDFASRNEQLDLGNLEDVKFLQTVENNIGTVVQHMVETGFNKSQILNHLMEILVTGDRSYETLARRLLGKDRTGNGYPSALEHYLTSMRDPMFWIINKKMVNLVENALQFVPSYERNELYFPGIEVVSVEVKKVSTLFDYFNFDVSEALKTTEDKTSFQIKIGQPRINHKPFTMKVNISSLVSQKGLVKIYLGPKVLPGEFVKNKNLFMLLDSFETSLKPGTNIIPRSSESLKLYAEDLVSLRNLNKYVQNAEFGVDAVPFKNIELQTGFPSRLMLPKGSPEGVPLQLFVFVAPFYKVFENMNTLIRSQFNMAVLSPGYPLDFTIEDTQLFDLPNVFLKDILVTHKGDSKGENYGGASGKKWYGDSYDPSSKPSYSPNNEPFDYQSKKAQYGKKDYYTVENEPKTERDISSIPSGEPNVEDESIKVVPINRPLLKLSLGSPSDSLISKSKSIDINSKKGKYENKYDIDIKRNIIFPDTPLIEKDLGKKIVIKKENNMEKDLSALPSSTFKKDFGSDIRIVVNKPTFEQKSDVSEIDQSNINQVPEVIFLPSNPTINIENEPVQENLIQDEVEEPNAKKIHVLIDFPFRRFSLYNYIKGMLMKYREKEVYV